MIEHIGKITAIGPTAGKNYSISGGPGDGTEFDFTLEVIGDKGTGIIEIHSIPEANRFRDVYRLKYRNKKTSESGTVSLIKNCN